jgi:hypothetical protein
MVRLLATTDEIKIGQEEIRGRLGVDQRDTRAVINAIQSAQGHRQESGNEIRGAAT